MLGKIIGRREEQECGGGDAVAPTKEQASGPSVSRASRQRYTKTEGETTLSFRPSQVGVHSIAARRREHQVAAEWDETRTAWEKQMATLRNSLNDERQASASAQDTDVAAATVNAFLAETDVLQNMQVGRPASDMPASRPAGGGGDGASQTLAPDISPLSARSEANGQRLSDEEDVDALMDAILLETG